MDIEIFDNLLGGRGKCRFCGEMENNVSLHEAHYCEKAPPSFPNGRTLKEGKEEIEHENRNQKNCN